MHTSMSCCRCVRGARGPGKRRLEEAIMERSTPASKASDSDWLVWQLLDSGLPTGGFAHSCGLEAAMQLGEYDLKSKDQELRAKGLTTFCRHALAQQASLLLPLVRQSYIECKDLEGWRRLDGLCQAMLTNEGIHRASVALGNGLLRLVVDAYADRMSDTYLTLLRAIKDEVRRGGGRTGHQGALFGCICASLGIPLERVDRMFLFLTVRDVLAAATRLNIVGPLLAVRVQASLHSFLEELVTRCKDQTEMRQVDPLLDVLQGAHEKLYCRLFIS